MAVGAGIAGLAFVLACARRMVAKNSARLCEIEISVGDKEDHAQFMRASLMALAQPF